MVRSVLEPVSEPPRPLQNVGKVRPKVQEQGSETRADFFLGNFSLGARV